MIELSLKACSRETLARHPQVQMECDQGPSRDVEKAQGNTGAPRGRRWGDTELERADNLTREVVRHALLLTTPLEPLLILDMGALVLDMLALMSIIETAGNVFLL